jgi:hypothetical protein
MTGYDNSCGMEKPADWALDFLMDVFQDWLDEEISYLEEPHTNLRGVEDKARLSFCTAVHVYRVAHGACKLKSGYNLHFGVGHFGWYQVAMNDWFDRQRQPVKFAAPVPQADKKVPNSVAVETSWVTKRVAQINAMRGELSLERERRWHEEINRALKARGDARPVALI